MSHRDPEVTLKKLSTLLPAPILKTNSKGAFGPYIDIKRPSKAVLESSLPALPSGAPIVQQLELLTSVVAAQTAVIQYSFKKQQQSFQKQHQCLEKYIAIEIGRVPRKVTNTLLWTSLIKGIILVAIVFLLIFHPFLYSHWRW